MSELDEDFQLTDLERIAFYYGCVFGGLLIVSMGEEREALRALLLSYLQGKRTLDNIRQAAQAVHAV